MNLAAVRKNHLVTSLGREVLTFGAIGVVATISYVLIYSLLRSSLSATADNLVALAITTLGNTAANRRLTFRVTGRHGLLRDHAAGVLGFLVALAITTAALQVQMILFPGANQVVELIFLVGSNGLATLMRFAILRTAIRRRHQAALARAAALRATELALRANSLSVEIVD